MTPTATEMGGAVLDAAAPEAAASAVSGRAPAAKAGGDGIPRHVARHLAGGTAALGFGVFLERGTGFLANILAARLAGASNFGAYSLAITTANNISTYAAGGIGATATRFSGKYPYGGGNYRNLAKVLAVVSLVSAVVAALALWFGAVPIAHLLGKVSLTPLLRWAAISAAGMILLECARGFFVGQRRLAALVLLSVLVGAGMLLLLPLAARQGSPVRMIVSQGLITASAVAVCLFLRGPLRLRAPDSDIHVAGQGSLASESRAQRAEDGASEAPEMSGARPFRAMLREVWSFGFVQLAGLVGSNLAGWWLTTLVARADPTLVQMSFFAIASQLRNLAGIAPSLLTEGSYAVMADPDLDREADRSNRSGPGGARAERGFELAGVDGSASAATTGGTPHRVMALCSFATLSVALLLAMAGIVLVPWALQISYGRSYSAAALTVAVGLAVAVVHMGNAPAAARLTIVSIRATGVINTVWALFVGGCASLFLFHGGSAWKAMLILFGAHVLSSCLVLLTLRRRDHVPAGMVAVFATGTVSVAVLATLAFVRAAHPEIFGSLTAAMALLLFGAASVLYLLGRRYRWLPSEAMVRGLVRRASGLLLRRRPAGEARHV